MAKQSLNEVLVQVEMPKSLAEKLSALAKRAMLTRSAWLRMKLQEIAAKEGK